MASRACLHLRSIIPLVSLLFLSACGVYIETQMLNGVAPHAKICPEAVRVFGTPNQVGAEYQEIAQLSVDTRRFKDWAPGPEQVVEAQRRKAASLGANGLVFRNSGGGYERYPAALAIYVAQESTNVAALCATRSRA